jgi:uncharacterized metal-binding protein YceD (DUF177 family)
MGLGPGGARAMIIEPWKIHEEGDDFEGDEPCEVLDLEPGSCVRAEGPIHYDLHAQAVSGELIVEGSLACPVALECSRCGVWFKSEVRDRKFRVVLDIPNRFDPVDLTPDIRESMIVAFPNFPLCSAECKGLCPRCGADRNRKKCRCKPEGPAEWGPFEGLKLK